MKKKVLYFSSFFLLTLVIMLYFEKGSHALPQEETFDFPQPVPAYPEEVPPETLDSLRQVYGHKKRLPPGYELQALYALRHYPELREVPIRFYRTDGQISLTSRPDFWSLLLPWRGRSYEVLIDTVKLEEYRWMEPTLLKNIPFNGQVGVLGHELAHTLSYLDKRGLELVWIGIKYLYSQSFRETFENATDRRAIRHGLGYQLITWSRATREAKVREGKGRLYLSPEQIREVMENYPMYEKVR